MQNNKPADKKNNRGAMANIKAAFGLNLVFTLLEIAGGIFTNSMAVISGAMHDLGDSLSLGLAWYLQKVSGKKRDEIYHFGYKRFSLLGAVVNSFVLVIGSMVVLNEAVPRIFNPQPIHVKGMLIFALVGILINGIAVLRLKRGSSLNEKVLSLHLLEDVLSWTAILIASIIMNFVYIPLLDPLLSLLVTLYVLFNVFKNLKTGLRIFLQAAPDNFNIEEIKEKILNLPGIEGVHDVHSWTLDGEYNILTIHLVLKDVAAPREIKKIKDRVKSLLTDLHISHVTIETEFAEECCGSSGCDERRNCAGELPGMKLNIPAKVSQGAAESNMITPRPEARYPGLQTNLYFKT
jgi:cobalt-zinc-cadmium efflux system protein